MHFLRPISLVTNLIIVVFTVVKYYVWFTVIKKFRIVKLICLRFRNFG